MLQALGDVLAVYSDLEGAVWIGGSSGGLNRLREGRFQPFARAEGLREDSARAVYEDRARNLWFSTDESLYRLTDGQLKIYPPESFRDAAATARRNTILTVTEDHLARRWRERASLAFARR